MIKIFKRGSIATFILAIAVTTVSAEPLNIGIGNAKLGGLLQGRYTVNYQDGQIDQFSLRRAEIKLSGDLTDKISWLVMFDPARAIGSGEGASTTTDVSANKQQRRILQDFAIDLKHIPYTEVKLGQFKIPFSMEGLASSAKLYTIERSMLNTQGNFGDFRDVGLQAAGGVDMAKLTLGLFNGEGQNTSDKNEYKDIAVRLTSSPLKGLHLGYAHYSGKSGSNKAFKGRNGVELEYTHDLFFFSSEAAFTTTHQRGWYIVSGYNVTPEVQLLIKGDNWDPNTEVSNNRLQDIVFGVNYFFLKHNAKFQLNYYMRLEESGSRVWNDQILAQLQVAL